MNVSGATLIQLLRPAFMGITVEDDEYSLMLIEQTVYEQYIQV